MTSAADTQHPGAVHREEAHESARKHVTGGAPYVDDLPHPSDLLHAYVGFSGIAHGQVKSIDLEAVRSSPGVAAVICAADIPGSNDISPVHAGDETVLADGRVEFMGQPLFAVAADPGGSDLP